MQKDLIFFGNGEEAVALTSTSANHIANMAKEFIQSKEKVLDNLVFYEKTVHLIGNPTPTLIQEGYKDNQIEEIPKMLFEISKAKSLIAWLREAIKARENLLKELRDLSLNEWAKANNITIPTHPEKDHILTEDEYYGSLSIKERNRYYQLETEAATIGKYIHPQGKYATARDEMKNYLSNPHSVVGSGRDALIYSYNVTIDKDKVENQFFELQKKHREIQASLNSIKFECQKAIEASEISANTKYMADLNVYSNELDIVNAQFKDYKNKANIEISRLKIIIPDSLKEIYNTISSLGKEKKG